MTTRSLEFVKLIIKLDVVKPVPSVIIMRTVLSADDALRRIPKVPSTVSPRPGDFPPDCSTRVGGAGHKARNPQRRNEYLLDGFHLGLRFHDLPPFR